MENLAKILIIIGLFLAAVGGALLLVGKIPGLGRLPGDMMIKKENVTFFFPLTTCILISLLLTFILFLVNRR